MLSPMFFTSLMFFAFWPKIWIKHSPGEKIEHFMAEAGCLRAF